MDESDVLYEVDGEVATITLNRPDKLNAFSMATIDRIRAAVEQAAADPEVVGIVITGAGKGFCAGLDASELGDAVAAGSSGNADADAELPGLFSWLLAVDKPVVAAVNGVAAGGGFVLAALADVRFASSAAWFTTVFSKRGLIAEHGTSWILPRLVGPGRALDLLWTSRRVNADEALRIGLVEYVVEPAALLASAQEYVRMLATSVSPAAMRDTKHMVYRHLGLDLDTAFRDAEGYRLASLDRPDATEGVQSFVERRPPRFERLGAATVDAQP